MIEIEISKKYDIKFKYILNTVNQINYFIELLKLNYFYEFFQIFKSNSCNTRRRVRQMLTILPDLHYKHFMSIE